MDSRRRHSSVAQLPSDVVDAVNSLLVEGTTYDDIVEFLKERGHEVSRSALGRYGKKFLSQLEHLRILEDQARAIVVEGKTPLAMEEALSKLLTAEIMTRTLDGGLKTVKNLSFITDAFAKLQRSSVARELMKKELTEKAAEAAKTINKLGKKKGIDPETLREIEQTVLGIVRT